MQADKTHASWWLEGIGADPCLHQGACAMRITKLAKCAAVQACTCPTGRPLVDPVQCTAAAGKQVP